MTPEDATFLTEIRLKILRNKEAGRPARDGLSDEEIAQFLNLLRNARATTSKQGEAKAKKKKKVSKPALTDEDVLKLFS